MTPGEKNIDEPLGDFSLYQERLQEPVVEQDHDQHHDADDHHNLPVSPLVPSGEPFQSQPPEDSNSDLYHEGHQRQRQSEDRCKD